MPVVACPGITAAELMLFCHLQQFHGAAGFKMPRVPVLESFDESWGKVKCPCMG